MQSSFNQAWDAYKIIVMGSGNDSHVNGKGNWRVDRGQ